MIDRIDLIQYLLDEIKAEKALREEYKRQCAEHKTDFYLYWMGRYPHKSIIKANIIKIKQLLTDERKKLDSEYWG